MSDTTSKLNDLAVLLEKGLITREQFEVQRDQLLSAVNAGTSAGMGQPSTIGAYKVITTLGEGGMGSVYRGRHRSEAIARRQGGDVAIKMMHPQYSQNEAFQERFEREATLGLKLDHPGIVKVHDLVVDGGMLALVMELVEGRALSEVIGTETGPIPWPRAIPLFNQLCQAVAHAHAHRVVHRDIKPENIVVSPEGLLKILDFGIAKDLTAGESTTRTSTGMGTVDYMAPEQYTDAKNVDHRADIYALGMTLYEVLAGRLPWKPDTTEYTVLNKKAQDDIPPPTDFYPDIPTQVVDALRKAIAVKPGDRFDSAAEFLEALLVGSTASSSALATDLAWLAAPTTGEDESDEDAPTDPGGTVPGGTVTAAPSGHPPAVAPAVVPPAVLHAQTATPPPRSRMPLVLGLLAAVVLFGILGTLGTGGNDAADRPMPSGYATEEQRTKMETAWKLCEDGVIPGCNDLGFMYTKGKGVNKDSVRGAEFFEKSCNAGHAKGCTNLGVMYYTGEGVAQDKTRAADLFQTGCEEGDSSSCCSLGTLYADGDGVTQDKARAAELYEKSCGGGDLECCSKLVTVSADLCKRMKADVGSYYGKNQTITVMAKLSNYYNYKYSNSEQTHISLKATCGKLRFNAYGKKSKFKDLLEYLLVNDQRPLEVTVVTDKRHKSNSIYTLLGWRKLTDAVSTSGTKSPQADENDLLCRRFDADHGSFYGKEVTFVATLNNSDYYNYKYHRAQKTHYSFKAKCAGRTWTAYAPKKKFQGLFEYVLDNSASPVKITVLTNKAHGDSSILTLRAYDVDAPGL